MKALWALIFVLVGGAVALALLPRGPGPAGPEGIAALATTPRAAAPATTAPRPAQPAAPPAQAAAVSPAVSASTAAATSPAEAPAAASVPAPPQDGDPLSRLGLDRKIPTATVSRGSLVRQPDGSILADGKWPIAGDGSAERPYEITWDLLGSAKESYQPRLGEFVIPQRVAMLDGAHVRISGYVAFPIVASEADECLLMLNQWDGCCIGVPPSPYDGIEARLIRAHDNSRKHLFLYGTLSGTLHVDPFVQGKWLVGLYTMTDADLNTDL